MLPASPPPLLLTRLAIDQQRWRLPREADLGVRLLNIPLSRHPDQAGLPYACSALPGRYLADLIDLSTEQPWQGPIAVLSPAWTHTPATLQMLLAEVGELQLSGGWPDAQASWLLLQSASDQALAYVLPPGWHPTPQQLLDLRFLTALDGPLDADLLDAMGIPCQLRRMRLPHQADLPLALPVFPSMQMLAQQTCRAASRMLRSGHRQTWAVITYHAGDVLLGVRAINACGQGIDGLVVHRAYADVARATGTQLPIIEIDGPLPLRGQTTSEFHPLYDDMLYFEQVVRPALPPDSAFIQLRPSRGYVDGEHTLGAQIAYTVGQRGDEARYPRAPILEAPTPALLQACQDQLPRIAGQRVLLHFDGGWPLKVYPPQWQQELIDRLIQAGFQPAVFGAEIDGVPCHQFTDLDGLSTLLQAHDVLIGMDSFPCHYASQQLGIPTICLFGPTRSENLAHAADNYLALEQGLDCSPCSAQHICPRFGGTWCRNFVPPAALVQLVTQCLITP